MANNLQMTPDPIAKALVITLPNGKQEAYPMTMAPNEEWTLVRAAKHDVLHDLSLEEVLIDLDRSVDLMFVAYCGVAGTKVQADVNDRQQELMDLCGDCLTQMTDFNTATTDVINRVLEAFHFLLSGNEERALIILSRCGTMAKNMSGASATLAGKFAKIAASTRQAQHETLVAQSQEVDKLDDLRKQHDEMDAKLASLNQANADLVDGVAALQSAYNDAKDRETEADKRAFISSIVSSFTSALGAGVGAYVAAKNPLATAAANLSNRPEHNDPAADAPSDAPTTYHVTQQSNDVSAAEAAAKELDAAKAAVASAETEVEAKKTAKDDALKLDSSKLAEAETALDEAEHNLNKMKQRASAAEEAKKSVDKATSGAKPSQDHVAAGVAAGMNNIADTTRNMMQDAQSASNSIREEKMKLLDAKLQLEKQKREVNAEVTRLAKSLTFNAQQTVDYQGALKALEMAVWAFSNIAVALSNAKLFWDNMATFCGRLASSDLVDKLKDEKQTADPPEARIAYYLSEWFMPTAVFYLARWVALKSISEDYLKAAEAARAKSTRNIRKSPSIDQARDLLPALKQQIADQLELDKAKSEQRSAEVMGELKLLAG